jgi:transposase
MRKVGIEEWLMRVVQLMHRNANSKVRVSKVLSPLVFIMVMEAISLEFRTGCPWEMLYAEDLVITTDSMDELSNKLSVIMEETH